MSSDINYHGPVVAFDLDDTLFRERDFCRSGFRFLCDPSRYVVGGIANYPAKDELDALALKMDEALAGRNNPFIPFEELFAPLTDSENSWNLMDHISAYRDHRPATLPFADGAGRLLDSLAVRGIRMAIITDGRSNTQRRKIEALGLRRYVAPDLILISEETGHDKHSKEMFAEVVRHFPEAATFWYVADNPRKDFYHPNLMGWNTAMVPYDPDNVHPYVEPESPLHAPKIKLNNISSLLQYI